MRCFLSAKCRPLVTFPRRGSGDCEGHRDVAPGGVGVGANLVRPGDELLRGVPVEVRDAHPQFDRESEPAVVQRADADAGRDLAAVDAHLLLPGDHLERGMETSRVPGREEHLGVGGAAGPAHLPRNPHVDVKDAVLAAGVAVAAVPGGMGGSGVQNLHQHSSLYGTQSYCTQYYFATDIMAGWPVTRSSNSTVSSALPCTPPAARSSAPTRRCSTAPA